MVGKIKSRFDLNRNLRHIVIRFKPQKIRFDCLRLEIWFDLLFLQIRFGPKWFGSESRNSPATAEWSDMPRSMFSKSTASSRASLPPLGICNGEDNLYLMEPVRQQDNPAAFWASPLAESYPILRAWPKNILSAPATSASVERLFSVAGIIRARRSSLAAATVGSLLFHCELSS